MEKELVELLKAAAKIEIIDEETNEAFDITDGIREFLDSAE